MATIRMTHWTVWVITFLAIGLGLLIAWGVVQFVSCERGEPTPAPWPTILERDNETTSLDLESDQAPDSTKPRTD